MTLKEWNAKQIEEALSELNRYYFYLAKGRPALEGRQGEAELILYYIESGGASGFRERNGQ